MKLEDLKENAEAVVEKLQGDSRFISRITAIGLTPGCHASYGNDVGGRVIIIVKEEL